MKLVLAKIYFPEGTNGTLKHNEQIGLPDPQITMGQQQAQGFACRFCAIEGPGLAFLQPVLTFTFYFFFCFRNDHRVKFLLKVTV
ncbi:hypothetical protein [Flavobacterium sp.]|uniref:hypothetical protein n=1 Tax=Flavobacterium sp. TaxID=239 RepID=UPI00121178E3|nr:hypothetical protein [Flavobacterium sp.]RZJ73081.1 MAG: hypothetical protein EOO49_05475 [Flavobacterium sp.]